jgi:hypothetical protein
MNWEFATLEEKLADANSRLIKLAQEYKDPECKRSKYGIEQEAKLLKVAKEIVLQKIRDKEGSNYQINLLKSETS